MRCIGSTGKLLLTAETTETAEEATFRARFLEPERCGDQTSLAFPADLCPVT